MSSERLGPGLKQVHGDVQMTVQTPPELQHRSVSHNTQPGQERLQPRLLPTTDGSLQSFLTEITRRLVKRFNQFPSTWSQTGGTEVSWKLSEKTSNTKIGVCNKAKLVTGL